jgi:hypothetical protein
MQPSERDFFEELQRRKGTGKEVLENLKPAIAELFHAENNKYREFLAPPADLDRSNNLVRFRLGDQECEIDTLNQTRISIRPPHTVGGLVLSYQNGEILAFIEGQWPQQIKRIADEMHGYRSRAKQIADQAAHEKYIKNSAAAFKIESPYPPEPVPLQLPGPKITYDWKRDIEELSYHIPKLIFISIVLFLIWVAYKYAPH